MDITSYNEITEQTISAIRWPSPYRPTVSYYTDTNFISNNLRGSLWQFAIKYVYYDYTHSVWSPISEVPLPLIEEDDTGNYIVEDSVNNTIQIRVPNGGTLVGQVFIAAREGNELFHLVKVIDKSDTGDDVEEVGSEYIYNFRNDSEKRAIPDEEIFRLYDDIPIKARHQEIIDKNIIAYAGVTKGYDPIDIDVSMNYEAEEVEPLGAVILVDVIKFGIPFSIDRFSVFIGFPDIDYEDLFVSVVIGSITTSHTFGLGDTNIDVAAYFAPILPTTGFELTPWVVSGTGIIENIYSDLSITIFGSITDFDADVVYKHPSFKTGVIHPFALMYKDHAGRVMSVLQNDRTKVEIPYDIPLNSRVLIKWEINHRPPVGSKYYQWLYPKNGSIQSYFQTVIAASDVSYDPITQVSTIDINRFLIDPITGYNILNTKSILSAYTWEKGDRLRIKAVSQDNLANLSSVIRIIPYDTGTGNVPATGSAITQGSTTSLLLSVHATLYADPTAVGDPMPVTGFIRVYDVDGTFAIGALVGIGANATGVDMAEAYHDFEIESQDGDEILVRTGDYNLANNFRTLVEVYKPKRTTEGVGIFFEFSPVYDVVEDGGELYHGGLGTGDQTDTTPAQGIFYHGDSYARVIYSDNTPANMVFGESELYSNFYESDVISIGRPVAYDPYQRQVELEQVVHGRRYFETTKINQLFSFYDDDRTAQLPIMFGKITGMRQRGGTLRVYQEKKATSIYIGAVMVKNADGSNQLVTSDQILGYVDIGKTDYGCAHPTSICTNQKTVYLFDVFNGSFLRDAVNGLFPISGRITMDEYNHDYKMTTYFKDKARALLASGLDNTKVYTEWDDVNEIVFVMFIDKINPNNNEIIGYHEPTNTWCSFYDLSDAYDNFPDCFGSGEQVFTSWLDGVLYRHNSDNVPRCYFYGDQKGCAVRVVSNAVPTIKKYFNALALHTNRAWEVPSIEIPADATYKRGMISYLSSAWFKLKRGVFYSAFKRNMKTKQDTETVVDLYNGDKLKGYYMEFDLVQDATTAGEYTELFKVDVEISDK